MVTTPLTIRDGGPDDQDLVLELFDKAVAWLVEHGRSGQWGTEPFSTQPKRIERVRQLATGGGLRIAEADGVPVGALVVDDQAPVWIPPVDEPELYINLLISDRSYTGNNVGGQLIQHALAEGRKRGIPLVRVDCYAGGDGALVRYYAGQGFTPTQTFQVDEWPGQVLEWRLEDVA